MGKLNELLTFAGAPLGTRVTGSIGHLITWRRRGRIQDKYYWFAPANPRSAGQQLQRWKFAAGVAWITKATTAQRTAWAALDPNIGSCPWFFNAMRLFMTTTHEIIFPGTRHELVFSGITDDEFIFTLDLTEYVPEGATGVILYWSLNTEAPNDHYGSAYISDPRGGAYYPLRATAPTGYPEGQFVIRNLSPSRKLSISGSQTPGDTMEIRVVVEAYIT